MIGRVLTLSAIRSMSREIITDTYFRSSVCSGIIDRQPVQEPFRRFEGDRLDGTDRPGQRELIIGDRQQVKLPFDRYDITKRQDVICIYVAIAKASTVAQVRQKLEEFGARATRSSCRQPRQTRHHAVPGTDSGCAMGEYFRDNGLHALTIYDDLSSRLPHTANPRLLRRPPGREAYPGDVFYLHSACSNAPLKCPTNARRS